MMMFSSWQLSSNSFQILDQVLAVVIRGGGGGGGGDCVVVVDGFGGGWAYTSKLKFRACKPLCTHVHTHQ